MGGAVAGVEHKESTSSAVSSRRKLLLVLILVALISCLLLYSSVKGGVHTIHRLGTLGVGVSNDNRLPSSGLVNELHGSLKDGALGTLASVLPQNYANENGLPEGCPSLTRLGSELLFDLHTCPPGSAMLDPTLTSSPPLHSDCPTLFVVGARKGGTTSMLQYMSQHPDFEGGCLHCPHVGETFYFSGNPTNASWGHYLRFFPRNASMTGESSVGYLNHCRVPKRIFTFCGRKAKIVMLFHNPIDRFVSNFLMRASSGKRAYGGSNVISRYETMFTTIHDAVEREILAYRDKQAKTLRSNATVTSSELGENWKKFNCMFSPGASLIFEGMYYFPLMNWLCSFPAENILIINSEEFYSNTPLILSQVVQFLGLRPLSTEEYEDIASRTYNQGRVKADPQPHQQLSMSDREKLLEVFSPFNKALMKVLHWNTTWN